MGVVDSIAKWPYKVAHFATGYLNVPPNKHRLFNAVGLCAGLVGGSYGANIIAGQTLEGEKIDPADVPLLLRPLHGLWKYDSFSDDPGQRWMKIAHRIAPVVVGGIGAGIGSDVFFSKGLKEITDKIAAVEKSGAGLTLVDAERQSTYHQGRVWGLFSKIASIFSSSSGFGLIPSWLNYSSTLGAKFRLDAEGAVVMPFLGKHLRASLLNNHSMEPLRPHKLLFESTIEHIVKNPSITPKNAEETITGFIKTWFGHEAKTPEQIKALEGQIEKFRQNALRVRDEIISKNKGKSFEQIETEVRKGLQGSFDLDNGNLEKRLIEAGIDPRKAKIGDSGMLTTFSRWMGDTLGFGTTKKMQAAQQKMIEGLEKRHPGLVGRFGKAVPADLTESSTAAKVAVTGLLASGAATLGAISTIKDTTMKDLEPAGGAPAGSGTAAAVSNGQGSASQQVPLPESKHHVHNGKRKGFVSGHLLDVAEGVAGMFTAGNGLHRVYCAAGLWLGSLGGEEVMKSLTGVDFWGKSVSKDKLWKPLQGLYKKLAFNPHSDAMVSKWAQVGRWVTPLAIGTAVVVQASKFFFQDRKNSLKGAKYLDEVEDKATMAQSEPWSYTAAITGLFGYPSGLPLMPFMSYSTHLGSRYSMASGRKVSLPFMGKWWSNNPTLFPYGPSGMLNMLIKEAVNNKAFDPELLETYAIGVLKPWFDNVTPKQVETFVLKLHELRDKYYKEGGIPEDMKPELEKELLAHFKGAGLEQTLRDIGLDPLKAKIANNGASGKIADVLGAKKTVDKIITDYKKDYPHHAKNLVPSESHATDVTKAGEPQWVHTP